MQGPRTDMPMLSLQNISKDYLTDGQRVPALKGLSLNVERGEFVALVGRSGCGKSTLLNLSGAMDFPTSGQVFLDGVSTSALEDAGLTQLRREKVGFIFQSFQLLHTLSVFENVELPLLLAGKPGAREAARRHCARAHSFTEYPSRRRAHRQSRHYDGQRDSGIATAPHARAKYRDHHGDA